ncbi:DUF2971 domain-containing protein [Clostridium tunisiense]|uniref:DUF2971 domain-containing protein n=1 Tax=Clostridium tunisiense TaxID=219748 RepID=UPI0002D7A919|nr:DUF2971 domain-containing protein [Clostridium tunisiense]
MSDYRTKDCCKECKRYYEENDWKRDYIYNKFPIDDEQTDKIKDISQGISRMPKSLYKYKSAAFCKDNLKDDTMWISYSNELNDPFECQISMGNDKEKLEKMYNNDLGLEPELFKQARKYNYKNNLEKDLRPIYDEFRKCVAVGSFSEEFNLVHMWSYYGGSHNGICLRYDFQKVKHLHSDIYPVVYQKCLPDITATNNDKNCDNYFYRALLTKSLSWKHEKEWRIIKFNNQDTNGYDIEMPKPKSVFLGCRLSNADKEEIKHICKEKKIDVWEMELSKDEYAMLFKKCTNE